MNEKLEQFKKLDTSFANFELQQATVADIKWLYDLEQKAYTGVDAISLDVLKGWYRANPNVFHILRRKDGERVGHIDVLPIRNDTLKLFLYGKILEGEINGDAICSEGEKATIRNLYIESVAIPYLTGYRRSCALRDALLGFDPIFHQLCFPDSTTMIYAMPASEEGRRIMVRLGFRILVNGGHRKDGHSMYSTSYSDFMERLVAQFIK
jgi:hypothetical protein